ncbi:ATP-binding protein [Carboxylicivirga marina]|uniref:ATP-binding protein n=1 Tax=Carboxylicivirga marina TaxID=2800988 RepID=A0ABS1HLA7_9BACT|nr:ATP-binding protein [Carboxylicivirga marina]MBK3518250.1 ATP-binding protein [Carboxylicivirga marina]
MSSRDKNIRWLQDGWIHYSFQTSLEWLDCQGKKQFGAHFSIHKNRQDILYKLLVYAIGDIENMKRKGLNPKKGLLVYGASGVGKSQLLMLLNYFFPPQKRFKLQSAREVSFAFIRHGYKLLSQYTTGSYGYYQQHYLPKVYCFDDVGQERPIHYFENECDVLKEIVLSRYDHYLKKGMVTHLLTEFTPDELGQRYGKRFQRRIEEMCNIIHLEE